MPVIPVLIKCGRCIACTYAIAWPKGEGHGRMFESQRKCWNPRLEQERSVGLLCTWEGVGHRGKSRQSDLPGGL